MSRRHFLRQRSSSKMEWKREEIVKSIDQKKKVIINYFASTCANVADSSSENGNDDRIIASKGNIWNWKRFLKPVLFFTVLVVTAVILIIFLRPESDTVCYIRVGCFPVSGPWSERPSLFNFVPQSPVVINTTLFITSRQDPTGEYGIVRLAKSGHFGGVVNEVHIPWNTTFRIVFLVHGFTDNSATWMRTLKDAFLAQSGNMIVVLVDWEMGASGHYPQIVANTRIVAREISLFIRHIQRRFGRVTPKQIHLVGHSLGSQISSYVGKSFVNSSFPIHQITALDPAFPLFEDYSPGIRLHKSDARHVLVIHSNIGAWGLGMKNPVGTVDIYLNNGRDQRGCPRLGSIIREGEMEEEPTNLRVSDESLPKVLSYLTNLKDRLACSHRRAYEWLEDVLRDLAHTHSHSMRSIFPVIAYPISWMNSTDIVSLAKNRAIHFSICKESGGNGCWKLEKSANDGFFQLPASHMDESSPSTFIIPTISRSPFCVRFALLEISTCPFSTSQITPLVGGTEWDSKMIAEKNITLALSQVTFEEEIQIYKGALEDGTKLKTWVEFPCNALQRPIQDDQINGGHYDTIFLSVKITVSLMESAVVKVDVKGSNSESIIESTNGNATRISGQSLCVNKMRLSYFNETEQDIIRLNWQMDSELLLISSKDCVQVNFPLQIS